MLKLIARRLAQMLLIMMTVTLILFAIFDSDQFKRRLAVSELGGFGVSMLSEADYQGWLERKGLNKPFFERYVEWIGNVSRGNLGRSVEKNADVSTLLGERLRNSAILALAVLAIMIPLSLALGVLAGMEEGSLLDRVISFGAVVPTSVPQIATAVLLTVTLALGLR